MNEKVGHPMGESKKNVSINKKYKLDTYGGTVHVEWETEGALTSLSQLAFFIEFLKNGSAQETSR